MLDRKTRTKRIQRQWEENTRGVRKDFFRRVGYIYGHDYYFYSSEDEEDIMKELEEILERNGYNDIYKQHVMAYRIINRWKSARVNPNTPLGRKVANKFADAYEEGV